MLNFDQPGLVKLFIHKIKGVPGYACSFFSQKKDLYKVDINEELFLSNGNDQTQVKNVDIYF
jgi:hypothetical protein